MTAYAKLEMQDRVEALTRLDTPRLDAESQAVLNELRVALRRGRIRAAERDEEGNWHVNSWVKAGILLAFRLGTVVDMSPRDRRLLFFDKSTMPIRPMDAADGIRIVPGGTSVRDGAYLAPGVILMPPSFVNVGAYVEEGSMIDSNALVGSCAQIGKRVHISAGAQIGGVLEPVGAGPVIIEDDVLVGGGCGVYEGTIVREGAVLAPGTILTGSTPVYDLARGQVYKCSTTEPLEIPAGAVVVPGTRVLETSLASQWGISIYAPVIIKYRDDRTERSVRLEESLR